MNVRKVIGMVLLSFGIMASVSASYTDDLKQKYADGSFYIEYQVTRQDAKGEIMIKDSIKKLSQREKNILNLRFMLGKTQTEVAKEIGISQAQVSRLEKSALKRIKGQ